MAWGTLIHGLLEHAMRHKTATRDDLRRLAMWLTVEEPQLRAVLDEAIDTVMRVATADFWREASNAEHSVETPFTFADKPSQLLSGVIDLFFKSGDGWRVIDYKTDVGSQAGASVAYQQQLDAYKRALQACGLASVDATVLAVRDPDGRGGS